MVLMFDVNLIAVVISAIIGQVIGALWYSAILFGNMWIKEMKMSKSDVDKMKKKSMVKPIAISFISLLVFGYTVGVILSSLGMTTQGLAVGILLWIGLFATSFLNSVLWEGKSVKLYLINSTYYLAVLLEMCFLFAVLG